jgi:hypothetical protein
MGMNAAESSQAACGDALGHNAGYEDLVMIADNDTGDLALPVDEQADLSSDFAGDVGNVPGEFG